MITVKEYADSRNKSVQAVYKQLHTSKRNKKKSLILQGIKPHRAKSAIAYGG